MKYSYSYLQMREADEAAVRKAGALTLMERAGKALADIVERAMARLNVDDVLFVCGGGNNGGDGFVAARLLMQRGKCAEALCLAEKFSESCAAQKERFEGTIYGRIPRRRYGLIVDCVLGTGLSCAPEGNAAELIEFINRSGGYVISADLPSGLAENGIALTPCVIADETVCMGLMKNSLLMSDGADVAGRITVAPIGIEAQGNGAIVLEDRDVAAYFPRRKSNAHKGMFGSACILAPYAKFTGAPFLSAEACLRSGVGYTQFVVGEELYPEAVGKCPSCVLQKFDGIGEILSCSCIAVGMGAGVSEALYRLMTELLQSYCGTLVIDADGLNTLAKYGVGALKDKRCRVIVTPHPKEFGRLVGKEAEEIVRDAVAQAEAFATEYGVTVILKNNRSVITDGKRTAINPTGSPSLSKGGSGDVLTGFLAGTCARGVDCFAAACVASYLLGRAGELISREIGEYASCASDLISYLPKAIAGVLSQ